MASQSHTKMSKEAYHREDHEPEAGPAEPELIYRYEDGYDAEIHPTFASLSRQFGEYAGGRSRPTTCPSGSTTTTSLREER